MKIDGKGISMSDGMVSRPKSREELKNWLTEKNLVPMRLDWLNAVN
jgi:hypothetical protein